MPKVLQSRFFIRKKDRNKGFATLFYRYQAPKLGVDMLVSSQIKVDVVKWNNALANEDAWLAHREEFSALHLKLHTIETAIMDAVKHVVFSKVELEEKILSIAEPKLAEGLRIHKQMEEEQQRQLEAQQAEDARRREEIENQKRCSIARYLTQFCNEIADGTRLTDNQRYTEGTVKSWRSFMKIYEGFDLKCQYTWQDIDRKFVARFVAFLEDGGYMAKSINKYLVTFRCLVGCAYKDELHNNDRALTYFIKKKVEEHQKAVEIYLTEEELDALYHMPLEGKRAEIRDVFLIGCYTCQRVSDYSFISTDSFITTKGGNRAIRFIQKKTNTEVVVPIMNPNLLAICEKYDYHLPAVNDVVLNRYIKDILNDLSKSVPSLAKMVTTQLTMKQKQLEEAGKLKVERNSHGKALMPRWSCVTSHTARRTGITHMYLSHRFTLVQMMAVSGHKTQKTFMEYIKLSSEEIADDIAAIANAG